MSYLFQQILARLKEENLEIDDLLTSADLLSFARQITMGMVSFKLYSPCFGGFVSCPKMFCTMLLCRMKLIYILYIFFSFTYDISMTLCKYSNWRYEIEQKKSRKVQYRVIVLLQYFIQINDWIHGIIGITQLIS